MGAGFADTSLLGRKLYLSMCLWLSKMSMKRGTSYVVRDTSLRNQAVADDTQAPSTRRGIHVQFACQAQENTCHNLQQIFTVREKGQCCYAYEGNLIGWRHV